MNLPEHAATPRPLTPTSTTRGVGLDELAPDAYARWALYGTAAMFGIYLILFAFGLAGARERADISPWQQVGAMIGTAIGFAVVLGGRPKLGGAIGLATLWVEFHIAFALSGMGLRAASSLGLVCVVVASTLLLGPRAAWWMAGVSVVTAPAAAMATHGWPTPDEGMHLVVLAAAVLGSAWMMHTFLDGYLRAVADLVVERRALRELVDHAPDALLALDADRRVIRANPAAREVLGSDAAALHGRSLYDLPLTDPEGAGASSLTDDTQTPLVLEAVDSGRLVELRIRPVRDPSSRRWPAADREGPLGFVVALRDVTARRQAERRSADLQAELSRAQKLDAVGLLAGGVAHDVNNLLTTVGGIGELLREEDRPSVQALAEELDRARQRGAALTQRLLSFARKELTQPVRFDAAARTRDLLVPLRAFVGDAITLELDVHDGVEVFLDPAQYEGLLFHLVTNARDAMPKGGSLHVAVERVEASAESAGGMRLRITDTGTGMSEAVVARAFDPFFTTKPRGEGTGLGLSAAHGIVTEAGGRIRLDSTPGRGTEITVVLPPPPEQARTTAEASGTLVDDGPIQGHVLYVEDDEASRRILTRMLRAAGAIVTEAATAEEALKEVIVGGQVPDVLVTDIRLPGLSGVQLASRLRTVRPDLRVLLITGYAELDLADPSFDPIEDLLLKPFTGETLRRRLRSKLVA